MANKLESPPRAADLFWFHSIELPDGVTPGVKSAAMLAREWESMQLPDLAGKSVLDIGAWDGFFSFRSEAAGAERVVSLDYHVWAQDRVALDARFAELRSRGEAAFQDQWQLPDAFDLERLPGRRPYELAHAALESRVEPVVGDFQTLDLETLERFDVVLYLGVLYHVKYPLAALERLRQVTREVAIIETEAICGPGSYVKFFGDDELAGDATNWWAPTEQALIDLCRTAGFSRVEVKVGQAQRFGRGRRLRYALKQLASSDWVSPPPCRAVVHAYP